MLTTKPEPARSPLQLRQNPVDWILGSVVLASLPVWVEWNDGVTGLFYGYINLFSVSPLIEPRSRDGVLETVAERHCRSSDSWLGGSLRVFKRLWWDSSISCGGLKTIMTTKHTKKGNDLGNASRSVALS